MSIIRLKRHSLKNCRSILIGSVILSLLSACSNVEENYTLSEDSKSVEPVMAPLTHEELPYGVFCIFSHSVRISAAPYFGTPSYLDIKMENIDSPVSTALPMAVPSSLLGGEWIITVDHFPIDEFFVFGAENPNSSEGFKVLKPGGSTSYELEITTEAAEKIRNNTTWLYFYPNPDLDSRQSQYYGKASYLYSRCPELNVIIEE